MPREASISGQERVNRDEEEIIKHMRGTNAFAEDFLFKQTVGMSSLLFKRRLNISETDKIWMNKEHPLLVEMIKSEKDGDMSSVFRLDSIAFFILTEQRRALNYKNIDFSHIETIPMPIFIPDNFIKKLELTVEDVSIYMSDEDKEILLDGFSIFTKAMTMLYTSVYPSLFRFTNSTDIKNQEALNREACNNYNLFLRFICNNKSLLRFCKSVELSPFFKRVRKRLYPSVTIEKSEAQLMKSQEDIERIKSFFTSYNDTFFSFSMDKEKPNQHNSRRIKNNEKDKSKSQITIFAPILFSNSFMINETSVFATSFIDVLIHYKPLVENKIEGKKHLYSIRDLNTLFFYKRYKAMGVDKTEEDESKQADKRTKKTREDIEAMTGNKAREEESVKRSMLLAILEQETLKMIRKAEEPLEKKLNIIFKQHLFSELKREEQIISILSQIRIILLDVIPYMVQVEDIYYKSIRDEIINKEISQLIKKSFLDFETIKKNLPKKQKVLRNNGDIETNSIPKEASQNGYNDKNIKEEEQINEKPKIEPRINNALEKYANEEDPSNLPSSEALRWLELDF